MNKLKKNVGAKITAIVLFVVLLAAFILAAAGTIYLYVHGGYHRIYNAALNDVLSERGGAELYSVVSLLEVIGYEPEDVPVTDGFAFVLKDETGNIIYDGLQGRESLWRAETSFVRRDTGKYDAPVPVTPGSADVAPVQSPDSGTQTRYTVEGYLLKDLPEGNNIDDMIRLFTLAFNCRWLLIGAAGLSALMLLLLFVFLMYSAGWRGDELKGGFFEKIPFDIFTLIVIALVGCIAAVLDEFNFNPEFLLITLVVFTCGLTAIGVLALLWSMSLAARIKLGTAVKGSLIYKVLAPLWRGVKKLWNFFAALIRDLPLIPKGVLAIFGLLLLSFIWYTAFDGRPLSWFIERAALCVLALYCLIAMKKLLAAGRELASGNMNVCADTKYLVGPFKEHADDLNSITDGMNRAVSERMKSEHLRTELITNVSHDIKTPLTSIVNYVDLLGKEDLNNEKAAEYIEVLKRQSAKLKKLIDDLTEASKASTGNLPVELARCDLGVLLEQTVGEFSEKLHSAGLEPVLTKPEEPVPVLADGRHMWRVLDNLMNNICKYAQRGTRVYLNLEKPGSRAVISLKNISAERLNISSEELMERFVQGDSSRNTEGSGLGLSIAQSLVKLQGGELHLTVDGDLFKVEIIFDTVK